MGIGVQKVSDPESAWYPWSAVQDLTGLKTAFCVLFEVKFHHLPVAHPCLLLLHLASKRGLPWRKLHPSFTMLSFLDKCSHNYIHIYLYIDI